MLQRPQVRAKQASSATRAV